MRIIKLIVLIILLTGCSAKWHLKQAIKKNSAIAQVSTYSIDTFFIRDSVVMLDTFNTTEIDTVTLTKDGVTTIVYRNHDVIRIKTIVKSDTIRYTKTITLPAQIKFVESKKGLDKYVPYLGLILLILLLLSIIKNSRRG
jgi:hypothetical protein